MDIKNKIKKEAFKYFGSEAVEVEKFESDTWIVRFSNFHIEGSVYFWEYANKVKDTNDRKFIFECTALGKTVYLYKALNL